jgi:Rrf2 family protein
MFSVTVRYALRALAELAALPEGATLLGKDIAQRAGVPSNYLSKILWTLGGEGFIDAIRGVRGGYRLRRRPEEIALMELVSLFDKPRTNRGCLLYEGRPCSDAEPCSAHDAWSKVGEAHTQFLEDTTLADISPPPARASAGPSGGRGRRRHSAVAPGARGPFHKD